MTSLPIIVGLIIGIALASLIFGCAFTLLCCVILAGLKALPMRNPFSGSSGTPSTDNMRHGELAHGHKQAGRHLWARLAATPANQHGSGCYPQNPFTAAGPDSPNPPKREPQRVEQTGTVRRFCLYVKRGNMISFAAGKNAGSAFPIARKTRAPAAKANL